jgi:hypothetical protein
VTAARWLTVAARFRGPSQSANGGYFAGLVAAHARDVVRVRLLRPPPLEVPLHVVELGDGVLEVRDHAVPNSAAGSERATEATASRDVIARATPAALDLVVPRPVPYMVAVAASRRFSGFKHHPFPSCFVCGTERARRDGLRLFPTAVGTDLGNVEGLVAGPWMPDETEAGRDADKVAVPIMYAALDCPGGFAVMSPGRPMLLAEMTAHVDRCARIGEPCVAVGWPIGREGRKAWAGSAVFGEDGSICARASALWIEPRAGSMP